MRTPTLQYLYLQKPVTMMVVICIISVLPWIGLGDFSTKGEPREAAVAISMLETGNWVLPQSYANEFAFKPPMAHWLMAAFSYPQGYVSEFTSRLPSALAFITLIGFVLVFFGKRIVKFQEAFIATLLLVTCVEIHRAAMTTRVDIIIRMRRSDQRTGRRSIAPIRIRHLSINVRSIQLSHHIQDFIICGNFLFIPTDVVVYRRMEAGWR